MPRAVSKAKPSRARAKRRAIARQRIELSPRDSKAFVEALLDPREPDARLDAAAQRYRKLIGG